MPDNDHHLHLLLVITTTVNQDTLVVDFLIEFFTLMIHSGMVRTVKAHVVAMENLPDGSEWTYPNSTNDSIEVCICINNGNVDTTIQLLELYVQ